MAPSVPSMLPSPPSDLVCTFAVLVTLAFLVANQSRNHFTLHDRRSRSSSPKTTTPYRFNAINGRIESVYIKYRRVLLA
jgi:hypothetical protein